MSRKMIGDILVEKGLVNRKTVERVVSRSKKLNRKLGALFEESEIITSDELVEALAEQHGCRVVRDITRFSFPEELLELIPVDQAMQHLIFPLKIEGDRFAVAMADPADDRIVNIIAQNIGKKIVPFIATRQDILAAISRFYLKKDPAASQETTILVVEDDKLLYTMLSDIFKKKGYRCIVATDGMEGYRMALTEQPDIIVTDKNMPKLDGYGLFEALAQVRETSSIPVILITSAYDSHEEARAFEKGFFDFIPKPIKEITILTRVKRALQMQARL
jgi:CheY-like chemotaxis protein